MRMKSYFFVLFVGLTSVTFAEAKVKFPSRIVCGDVMLITQLEGYHTIADVARSEKVYRHELLPAEEKRLGGWWGGYFTLSVESNTLRAFYYSCDTEDRDVTWKLADLAAKPGTIGKRKVQARLTISTRGEVDFDGPITCVATYR